MRDLEKRGRTTSGEGERRAMRGFMPQYDFAARLIYDALIAGKLQWVGLTDRAAGSFDDIVLGLQDRVVGYQVKSSRDPESFRCRDLLLGARNLLARFVETSTALRIAFPDKTVQVGFVTDDYPSTRDNLARGLSPVSSAAFLRLFAARGNQWTASQWRSSEVGDFFDELQRASGLSEDEFSSFWKGVFFK